MSSDKEGKALIGVPFSYTDLIDYQEGSIVSRTIVDEKTGTITVFAFDSDQSLSEHTAPFDALVNVVDGHAVIIIDGKEYGLSAGYQIIMPADIPHAVRADQKFKMVLTMIRR